MNPLPPSAAVVGSADAILREQLQQAEEAADFLLTSVIQAQKKQNGRFGQSQEEQREKRRKGRRTATSNSMDTKRAAWGA